MAKVLIILLAPSILFGCTTHSDKGRDWPAAGPVLYTSPGGLSIVWLGSGVTDMNSTGVHSDGTAWEGLITWDDIGAAMDAQVVKFIKAHPSITPSTVWAVAKSCAYYIEDDYLFRVLGNPADTASPYAAGESQYWSGGGRIMLALWSRLSSPSMPNAAFCPAWTFRAPYFAGNGSASWHYGGKAYTPALAYELGWFFGVN